MSETFEGRDLSGARLRGVSLRGARVVGGDLSDAVLRAVDADRLEIDAPWLLEGGAPLVVNGVDVTPYVDAELDRRFPGRAQRRAADPDGLRSAWTAVEEAWARAIARAEAMPAGSTDESVDGEWSFAQTLRHLVMAIDTWLGRAVLGGGAEAYHPIGQPNAEYALDGGDPAVFHLTDPTWEQVREVLDERFAQVRGFLAGVGDDDLEGSRPNPWAPEYDETVRACLHTILEESWEHLRYAERDLAVLDQRGSGSAPDDAGPAPD